MHRAGDSSSPEQVFASSKDIRIIYTLWFSTNLFELKQLSINTYILWIFTIIYNNIQSLYFNIVPWNVESLGINVSWYNIEVERYNIDVACKTKHRMRQKCKPALYLW